MNYKEISRPIQVARTMPDQSGRLQKMAQPANHSSRDRGPQLKIGTSGTRHGNRHPHA